MVAGQAIGKRNGETFKLGVITGTRIVHFEWRLREGERTVELLHELGTVLGIREVENLELTLNTSSTDIPSERTSLKVEI
jgi:hypothetical protein